jgi:hypothetical protein
MKRTFLPLLLVALLTACESELTDYNNRPYAPQLVMNAQLEEGAATNYVYLNLSQREEVPAVSGAEVTLTVNGGAAETGTEEAPGRYAFTTQFRAGDRLRLDAVTRGGEHHAWAEVNVPQALAPIAVDTLRGYEQGYTGSYRLMDITLSDRVGEKNYYRLDVRNDLTIHALNRYGEDTIINVRYHDFYADEELVFNDGRRPTEEGGLEDLFTPTKNTFHLFPDSYFADRSYTISCTAYRHELNIGYFWYDDDTPIKPLSVEATLSVRLLHLDEQYYRYLRLLNMMQNDNYDSALMEPVILPVNVTGGLGFVAAAAVSEVKMQLQGSVWDYNEEYNPYSPYW